MNPFTGRLLSLDILRGYTIAAMILVNFPGDENQVFHPLSHTPWNGLSFTDLIAPVFLFVVGVSIALAYQKKRTFQDRTLYLKIISRALKIFAVGMFLNLMPDFDFDNVRYTGTLHRIAIVFLVCAILYLKTQWKTQAIVGSAVLILYWLALTCIPTPGLGRVALEPGLNLVAWFDTQFLPGKMWQGTWDPESLLSTFPAIVSGITGMLAGKLLLSDFPPNTKSNYLMTAGLVSIIAGYCWGLAFPVNENLWTSSFVLVTSGIASLLLGSMYFVVDINSSRQFTRPGIIFGSNAIAVYVMADLLALVFYRLPFGTLSLNRVVTSYLNTYGMDPRLSSMLYALAFVLINFIPVYWLFRRKIFIKL